MKSIALLCLTILFMSCVSAPQGSTIADSPSSSSIQGVEYNQTFTYNLIAFTGDKPDFQYPVEVVNFFISNFKSTFRVSNITILSRSNATFDNLKAAVDPYKNVDGVVNIILYSGHGSTVEFESYLPIQYKSFFEYLNTTTTPTIVLAANCNSGNLSKYLKPGTPITLITASMPDVTTSSGSNNGVYLDMLASIIYALQEGTSIDSDGDHQIQIDELVSAASANAAENIETYGKGWARFGVYLWGDDTRVVATY